MWQLHQAEHMLSVKHKVATIETKILVYSYFFVGLYAEKMKSLLEGYLYLAKYGQLCNLAMWQELLGPYCPWQCWSRRLALHTH